MKYRLRVATVSLVLLSLASWAAAYHFIQAELLSGEVVDVRWPGEANPVPYWVNDRNPLDFSLDDALEAVDASFRTWQNVETATITFERAGVTSAGFEPFDEMSTLTFSSDPSLEGTGILGATLQVIDIRDGSLVEADIFFSNFFIWSVDPAGEPNTFDFVSVATHEIGHFIGLDHSHVGIMETRNSMRELVDGSAIMFPFSFGPGSVTGRELTVDDAVGVSLLYPAAGFTQSTGAISGRVTDGGVGVPFAHVVAFNPFTGETIGAFANESGDYQIRGLSPGPQTVRVNPITDPTSPGDFGFPEGSTPLDYPDALLEGTAAVRAGQNTFGIDVEVRP